MRTMRIEDFPTEDRVTIRLRHGDRERLREVAESQGMTVSAFLRDAAEIAIDALAEPPKSAAPAG